MVYVPALAEALMLQASVVERLTPDTLGVPSQCAGWSIRDVLEHSVGVTRKFTAFAAGLTDEPHAPRGDVLGPYHAAALRTVADASAAAWRAADMSRLCQLGFGTFTAEAAAGINLFDVLAHTWDIAASIDVQLDEHDGLWVIGLDAAQHVIGPDRDSSHYGPELHAEATAAPMARFLAYLGRRYRN